MTLFGCDRSSEPQTSASKSAEEVGATPWQDLLDDPIKNYSETIGSFSAKVASKIEVTKGPIAEKLSLNADILFASPKRWRLVRENPLERSRWEVYSFHDGQKKVYLRKNEGEFQPAEDTDEMQRWLATALVDFFQLLDSEFGAIDEETRTLPVDEQYGAELANLGYQSSCTKWEKGESEDQLRTLRLCQDSETGLVLKGDYAAHHYSGEGQFPIASAVQAEFAIVSRGEAVISRIEPKEFQ